MTKPPPLPWTPGVHADHSVVRLVMEIVRLDNGQVFSRMTPASDGDNNLLLQWPGHGLEQVGFATLVEAVRREARTSVLVRLSNDPEFRGSVFSGHGIEFADDLASVVETVISKNLARLSRDAVIEVLRAIESGGGFDPDPKG